MQGNGIMAWAGRSLWPGLSRTKWSSGPGFAGARGRRLSPRSIKWRSHPLGITSAASRAVPWAATPELVGGGGPPREPPEGRGRERSEGTGHAQRQGSEGAASPAPERPQPRGAERPAF